ASIWTTRLNLSSTNPNFEPLFVYTSRVKSPEVEVEPPPPPAPPRPPPPPGAGSSGAGGGAVPPPAWIMRSSSFPIEGRF
ncbi:hypothetical protein EON79_18880, partial [bacterium]